MSAGGCPVLARSAGAPAGDTPSMDRITRAHAAAAGRDSGQAANKCGKPMAGRDAAPCASGLREAVRDMRPMPATLGSPPCAASPSSRTIPPSAPTTPRRCAGTATRSRPTPRARRRWRRFARACRTSRSSTSGSATSSTAASRSRRELRALSDTLPIIFLSARDSDFDIVAGLRLGADDYLTKDVSLPHLAARIAALFRRSEPVQRAARPEDIARARPAGARPASASPPTGAASAWTSRSPSSGWCIRWRATPGTSRTATR